MGKSDMKWLINIALFVGPGAKNRLQANLAAAVKNGLKRENVFGLFFLPFSSRKTCFGLFLSFIATEKNIHHFFVFKVQSAKTNERVVPS